MRCGKKDRLGLLSVVQMSHEGCGAIAGVAASSSHTYGNPTAEHFRGGRVFMKFLCRGARTHFVFLCAALAYVAATRSRRRMPNVESRRAPDRHPGMDVASARKEAIGGAGRIEDPRLKRAFRAAVGLEEASGSLAEAPQGNGENTEICGRDCQERGRANPMQAGADVYGIPIRQTSAPSRFFMAFWPS